MDFPLTEEQLAIQKAARDFASKEIAPLAQKMDREEDFDRELLAKAAKLGYLGVAIPEEYGGTFVDHVTTSLIGLEFGRASAAIATLQGASAGLFGGNLAANGTEEQKQRYLPKIANGEWIGCMGLTEPEAGSDAFSIRTKAVKKGDRYILNGSKTFISNAPVADVALIYANLEASDGAAGGISTFVVEKNFPGYSAGEKFEKMGLRASPTGQIFLEDCEVPEENLVGMEPGRGLKQMIKGLNVERFGWSALAVGLARAAFTEAFNYANERKQFGQTIYSFQMIQDMLARMATDIHLGELSVLNTARLCDSEVSISLPASYCKLFCCEMVMRVCSDAVQIHGGYGYMREYAVERYLRDAKVFAIGAGTSQVQKLIIAHQLLMKGID